MGSNFRTSEVSYQLSWTKNGIGPAIFAILRNSLSRLKRLKHENSSDTFYDDQFTYNAANQISQIAGRALTRDFTYDNIDRLTEMSDGTNTESYSYDAVGNRTMTGYTTGAFNRLTAANSVSYDYNGNGSMTSRSTGSSFRWDRENRLVSAQNEDLMGYAYDALGRRILSRFTPGNYINTTPPVPERYTYDGPDVILDDNTDSDRPSIYYQNAPGIDNKLEMTNDGRTYHFLQDHLGSTVAVTDTSGEITAENSYDSFGNPTNMGFSSRYQFTGREYDSFTGLQFSRARFYDPNLGRFISEDPIGFGGGDVNLYGYVRNNPTSFSDPMGLWPFKPPKGGFPTSGGNLPGTSIPYRMDMRQQPYPNMHVFWDDGSTTVINHKGGWPLSHGGRPNTVPPMSYRANLRPVVNNFKCRVKAKFPGGFGGILNILGFIDGAFDDYERWNEAGINGRTFDEQMCEDFSDAGPYVITSIGIMPNAFQNCKGI